MILNDREIKKLVENSHAANGKPLIENFNPENLEGATYDITMGDTIHTFKKGTTTLDLKEKDPYEEVYDELKIDDSGYVLDPSEYILITLNEGLNLPDHVVCEVLPKTKLIRAGLTLSPQYCNPSYYGILQLGIKNDSPNSVKIYPNFKIGQYIFKALNSVPENLYRNKKSASYQSEDKFRGAKFSKEDISRGKEILEMFRHSLKGEN